MDNQFVFGLALIVAAATAIAVPAECRTRAGDAGDYGTTTTTVREVRTSGSTTAATTVPAARSNDPRSEVLRILKQYSPTGYHIVDSCVHFSSTYTTPYGQITMPVTDFMVYFTVSARGSINTIVHEMCHQYTSFRAFSLMSGSSAYRWDSSYNCYYTGGRDMMVECDKVFPASEMNPYVPQAIKDSRYETYVYPSDPQQSTQVEGVFGLLDEWNAYYQGTEAAFDLYDYYKNETPGKPGDWLDYTSEVFGTYYASAEFKLFILNYLLYAKNHKPDAYRTILNNAAFVQTYRSVDANWQTLLAKIETMRSDLAAYLAGQGYRVNDSGDYFMINGTGRGSFRSDYLKLSAELSNAAYRPVIDALR